MYDTISNIDIYIYVYITQNGYLFVRKTKMVVSYKENKFVCRLGEADVSPKSYIHPLSPIPFPPKAPRTAPYPTVATLLCLRSPKSKCTLLRFDCAICFRFGATWYATLHSYRFCTSEPMYNLWTFHCSELFRLFLTTHV